MNPKLRALKATPPWERTAKHAEFLKEILRGTVALPEKERVEAASLAGDLVTMSNEMATLLLSVVQNPQEPLALRGQAAIALGPVLDQTGTDGFDDLYSTAVISEEMFDRIRETLRKLYFDFDGAPKEVRRRALEASVRASEDWHGDAIRKALESGDNEWMATALLGTQYVPGFDKEILAALKSKNPDIHVDAVRAAGARGLDEAWPEVTRLLKAKKTPRHLLFAAIEAAVAIRPEEAGMVLMDLTNSTDKQIAEAAAEAMMEADAFSRGLSDGDDDDEDWAKDDDFPPTIH